MDLANWMSLLDDSIQVLPLAQVAIPGSHDSLTYTITRHSQLAPDAEPILRFLHKLFGPLVKVFIYRWGVTQRQSVVQQLNRGIRYFDLRLATKENDNGYYVVHGLYGANVEAPLREIAQFVRSKYAEICIVDFQHFYSFTHEDHLRLVEIILRIFKGILCPRIEDMNCLNLKRMAANNHKVIVVYRYCIENPDLWLSNELPTPWPNTMSPNHLIKYLSDRLNSRNKSRMFVSQCVLTPSFCTVFSRPWSGVYKRCALPAAKVVLPWLNSLEPKTLNIAISDFVGDNDSLFVKTVISLNRRYDMIDPIHSSLSISFAHSLSGSESTISLKRRSVRSISLSDSE